MWVCDVAKRYPFQEIVGFLSSNFELDEAIVQPRIQSSLAAVLSNERLNSSSFPSLSRIYFQKYGIAKGHWIVSSCFVEHVQQDRVSRYVGHHQRWHSPRWQMPSISVPLNFSSELNLEGVMSRWFRSFVVIVFCCSFMRNGQMLQLKFPCSGNSEVFDKVRFTGA